MGKKIIMPSHLQHRRAMAEKAMPVIKRLVNKYDLASLQNCINQLREYDKAVKELKETEKKADDLRKVVGK